MAGRGDECRSGSDKEGEEENKAGHGDKGCGGGKGLQMIAGDNEGEGGVFLPSPRSCNFHSKGTPLPSRVTYPVGLLPGFHVFDADLALQVSLN